MFRCFWLISRDFLITSRQKRPYSTLLSYFFKPFCFYVTAFRRSPSVHIVLTFREQSRKLHVFSVKVALATLCTGKLLDKLRYIFSQISDNSGVMDYRKFCEYLREVLALPAAVFEGPTFSFSENAVKMCFEAVKATMRIYLYRFKNNIFCTLSHV
ncbi:unnamed protein product [Soboliphyme baturini]|uniref:EF-hand_3 domain-containing protein n=1 Tax=Soboliphyme baturini TaxID=241478 RepID=A0A183I9Y1_9BILA|nr:unnamed protein product [Soboliphyme baturini]